jgi:predicted metal-dependent hydrolase
MTAGIHDHETLVVGELTFTVAPPTERKTLQITVDRDASLILRAPTTVTRKQAEQFVRSKRNWVYRKLAEKDALVGPPVVKRFVDGEGFAYLGRNYRLKLHNSVDAVRLSNGRFLMSPETARHGTEAMRRWYTTTGRPWLQQRAEPWIKRLELGDVGIVVLDLGHRWGSTRGHSTINIHWAALQLPPSLIDYVLAHELAHVKHQNHTPDFWQSVAAGQRRAQGHPRPPVAPSGLGIRDRPSRWPPHQPYRTHANTRRKRRLLRRQPWLVAVKYGQFDARAFPDGRLVDGGHLVGREKVV